MMFGSRLFTLLPCLLLLGLAACGKGPSAPSGQAEPTAPPVAAAAMPSAKEFAPASELSSPHFDFDKSEVRAGDGGVLDQTARWLKSRPEMRVQIAGHADERGSDAYNLALGERRAQAVKTALTRRGIDGGRLTATSYGENRPLCGEHTEGCRAKNRRAEFLVKAE